MYFPLKKSQFRTLVKNYLTWQGSKTSSYVCQWFPPTVRLGPSRTNSKKSLKVTGLVESSAEWNFLIAASTSFQNIFLFNFILLFMLVNAEASLLKGSRTIVKTKLLFSSSVLFSVFCGHVRPYFSSGRPCRRFVGNLAECFCWNKKKATLVTPS